MRVISECVTKIFTFPVVFKFVYLTLTEYVYSRQQWHATNELFRFLTEYACTAISDDAVGFDINNPSSIHKYTNEQPHNWSFSNS